MRRHTEGERVLTEEWTSGRERLLTVVVDDSLTVVYPVRPGEYNTVVSKHLWCFSASRPASARAINSLKGQPLPVGYRNAVLRLK
jgi:hypothetical protein